MFLQGKTIAIVGGGPGGLTLARLLQRKGITVTVYERDLNPAARVQGATLDLHPESGLAALREARLLEAFYAHYRPNAGKLRLLDQQARIRLDQHENATYEEDRPEIDRGPLRTLLLASLKPGTVVWNSQFVTMTPAGNGWQLQFNNGTTATADLVIGADGANSRIRPFLTDLKPFYSGITLVEGAVYGAETAVPRISALLQGGKIFAFGDSKSLILGSKGDGSLAFYAGFAADESWSSRSGIDFGDKAQVIRWFRTEFAGWDPLWSDLFEKAEPYFVLRPQYCMPLDQTWPAQPALTMLGDAAHLMPPYAGEGVNMAMLDALELSQCLTSPAFRDCQSALAAYETGMRARASETARITLEQTALLHSPDALAQLETFFA